jgi:hypothetical protein
LDDVGEDAVKHVQAQELADEDVWEKIFRKVNDEQILPIRDGELNYVQRKRAEEKALVEANKKAADVQYVEAPHFEVMKAVSVYIEPEANQNKGYSLTCTTRELMSLREGAVVPKMIVLNFLQMLRNCGRVVMNYQFAPFDFMVKLVNGTDPSQLTKTQLTELAESNYNAASQ